MDENSRCKRVFRLYASVLASATAAAVERPLCYFPQLLLATNMQQPSSARPLARATSNLAKKKQPLRKSASPLQQPTSRNFSYRGRCKQRAQQCTCIVFCAMAIPNTVRSSHVWITAISHGSKKRRFKSSNQHVHRQKTTCHRLHQYQVRENT